jgi:hypothetical protein
VCIAERYDALLDEASFLGGRLVIDLGVERLCHSRITTILLRIGRRTTLFRSGRSFVALVGAGFVTVKKNIDTREGVGLPIL